MSQVDIEMTPPKPSHATTEEGSEAKMRSRRSPYASGHNTCNIVRPRWFIVFIFDDGWFQALQADYFYFSSSFVGNSLYATTVEIMMQEFQAAQNIYSGTTFTNQLLISVASINVRVWVPPL